MSDFRATGGPQIGPLPWRLGPPGPRAYPPRVAIFAPEPPSKTPDLGIVGGRPKSCVLNGGIGLKSGGLRGVRPGPRLA